ncbi:MAG: PQQ-binding-like beta-propeller repeat protein [Planctomycetaceae bacterium]
MSSFTGFGNRWRLVGLLALLPILSTRSLAAADWPMWRHDAGRSAATDEELATTLHRRWTRHLPRLQGAWLDQDHLTVDAVYQPIVANGLLYVGSSYNDTLVAWDLASGKPRWRFAAEGPIRYAPVADKGRVYFVADDGCLYCLDGLTGKLRWRNRAAPTNRKVLGNGRLVSAWPARGAPVLLGGQVYFAASIWPFMGIFIQAVDAETGQITWSNDGTGSLYMLQPHNSPAFAGLAPQGYLAARGDTLMIPNGRSVPARLDRHTGRLKYFQLAPHRADGGDQLAVSAKAFFSGGVAFDLETGVNRISLGGNRCPIFSGGIAYTGGNALKAWNIAPSAATTTVDRKGQPIEAFTFPVAWSVDIKAEVFLKAGKRLYGTNTEGLVAIDLPVGDRKAGISWTTSLEGTTASGSVTGMLAAAGHLVVVTSGGAISCYGPEPTSKPVEFPAVVPLTLPPTDPARRRVAALLKTTGARDGIAVVLGLEDGGLVEALSLVPRLQVIGVDADAGRVRSIRRRLDAAGISRTRAAVHVGDPLDFEFPPYLANLVTTENLATLGIDGERIVRQAFNVLRPYGGVAVLPLDNVAHIGMAAAVERSGIVGGHLRRADGLTLLERRGPLPGSAPWTHQYADVGNTSVSKDNRVKAPLGLLWFGGSSNKSILPRHGHGPTEQVIGGRLFIEGPDLIRAVDVYTGRVLWEARLPGVGKDFNFTGHQPGANATGSNYASVEDGVYVAYRSRCIRLDPVTGSVVSEFPLPPLPGGGQPKWGYIGVWQDLLIAGADPLVYEKKRVGGKTHDGTTSRFLVVMNRHNGRMLWSREARYGFRHNAIVLGNGKLYTIDRLPETIVALMARRGRKPTGRPQLLALDARSGREVWSTTRDVFGTWLGFSNEYDLLLHCGRAASDMLLDEPSDRMVVYRGRDGTVRWDKPQSHGGPCLINGRMIFTQGAAVSLLTGETLNRINPLTGKIEPWNYTRNYGCNSAVGSRHLLTFRSAAAGFFDLARDGGTGNLGGFRSSCSTNLICADGVLNAPDYTRTCTCSYQNQASLALVHDPTAEMWTFNKLALGSSPIRRMGLNLGAPGDRRHDDGTLWLEYPIVGGPSPQLDVKIGSGTLEWYCGHSARMNGGTGPAWIGASGVRGIGSLRLGLPGKGRYTIRLHFAEPDAIKPGRRRFSVLIQGRIVVEDLDIIRTVGRRRRTLVREVTGVEIADQLRLQLVPFAGSLPAVLSGIEVLAEEK